MKNITCLECGAVYNNKVKICERCGLELHSVENLVKSKPKYEPIQIEIKNGQIRRVW